MKHCSIEWNNAYRVEYMLGKQRYYSRNLSKTRKIFNRRKQRIKNEAKMN